MDLAQLKFLLAQYKLTPNKVRGQNFLVSDQVLSQIINTAKLENDDLVLEVGPGLGALTQELVKKVDQVVSFEVDKNFAKLLGKLENVNKNLQIEWQDILSLTDQQWQNILFKYEVKEYKVVANIPYYLTSKLINKFVSTKLKPQSMTLLIQNEVAERIITKNNKHSLLSLAVAFYAQASLVDFVSKDNFYPIPKVNSAILYINKIKDWSYPVDERRTWQFVHYGFAAKRKKLINNLLSDKNIAKERLVAVFDKIELDKNIRAEDLSVQNWIDLTQHLI